MIGILFSAIALGAALVASFVNGMRTAILSLWIAGLAMGCLYVTLGAESLAVIQWIVSTLVAISLFFFAVMFGEYEKESNEAPGESLLSRKKIFVLGIAIVLGLAFAAIIYLGATEFPQDIPSLPKAGNDLAALGRTMVENHMLSLEVLGLTLFLILVGGGVVARPEPKVEGETVSEGDSC